jgi:hypothetical protein
MAAAYAVVLQMLFAGIAASNGERECSRSEW